MQNESSDPLQAVPRVLAATKSIRSVAERPSAGSTGDELAGTVARVSAVVEESLRLVEERLRVAVIGEFNAGKSTLVNALFRREVAATDLQEMTSWIAVYRSGPVDEATIRYRDGGTRSLPLEAFHAQCDQRAWSAAELARWQRVDIEVARTNAPFTLIDVPGSGSITTANEERLLEALQWSDAIVWLIDADTVGEAAGMALARKLTQGGVHLVPVVTKIDVVDYEEGLETIRAFLGPALELAPDAIRGVAAGDYQEAGFRATAHADGVDALREHLSSLTPVREQLRRESGLGRVRMAVVELLEAGVRHQQTMEGWRSAADRRRDQLLLGSQVARADAIAAGRRYATEHLFEGHSEALEREFQRMGAQAMSQVPAWIAAACGPDYLTQFRSKVVERVQQAFRESWSQSDDATMVELRSEPTWNHTEVVLAGGPPPSGGVGGESDLMDHLRQAALTGGLTTLAFGALEGVTLGAALTGVGLPVAAVGAMAAAATYYWKKKREGESARGFIATELPRLVRESLLEPAILETASRLVEAMSEAVEASPERAALEEDYAALSESLGDLRAVRHDLDGGHGRLLTGPG